MQRLSHDTTDQELVIALSGEIIMDMVLEQKGEMSRLVLEHAGTDVVLDLAEVAFMDSSGVGLLIGLRRLCQEQGKAFRVVNPTPAIRRLFDTLRLTDYLTVSQAPPGRPAA